MGTRGRDQNDLSPARQGSRQSVQNKQTLVDGTQSIRADHDRKGTQGRQEIPRIEILAQRTAQSSGPFDDEARKTPLHFAQRPQDFALSQRSVLLTRRKNWCQWSFEIPGVDLSQRQHPSAGGAELPRIRTVSRAHWLQGNDSAPFSVPMTRDQGGNNRLANAGVGAGDKESQTLHADSEYQNPIRGDVKAARIGRLTAGSDPRINRPSRDAGQLRLDRAPGIAVDAFTRTPSALPLPIWERDSKLSRISPHCL